MKKIYLQIIILLNLFLVIIWYYPTIIDFLIIHNRHYSIPNEDNKIDLIAERGTFGDMFGLLNTVFSGIALLGVVYTIYDEKERVRKEKLQFQKDKLSYFLGVLRRTVLEIDLSTTPIITSISLLNDDYLFYDHIISERNAPSNFDRLNKIINSLNEEEYFLAYIENIDLSEQYTERSTSILVLFDTLHEITGKLEQIQSSLTSSKDYILSCKEKIALAFRENYENLGPHFSQKFEICYREWQKSNKSLYDIDRFINSMIEVHELSSEEYGSSFEYTFINYLKSSNKKLKQIEELIKGDVNTTTTLIEIIESEKIFILLESQKISTFIQSNKI